MNTTKQITIAAAITALCTIQSSAAQADEEISVLTMKPMQAANFARGNEHFVTYYLSENGRCKLYVTHAVAPDWDAPSKFIATRFEAVLDAGTKTRYVSSSGRAFDFACADDALAMNVMPIEQVASSTTP